MNRHAWLPVALSALTLLFTQAACGSGYDEERAKTVCEQERAAKAPIFTDDDFAKCVACYEECGDGCVPKHTTPYDYVCAE